MSDQDAGKKAAGIRAASMIEDGMRVGLGTGSTASVAIVELGRRIREDGLSFIGTPTSYASELLAQENDIPLCDLRNIVSLDFAFDGADEVDGDLRLIKGRGAAHTREKVVASLARRFVVLVDESKRVDRLGTKFPVPIEVVPMAAFPVMRWVDALGARSEIRMAADKDGPVVTDQGLWIVDARFENGIEDPDEVDRLLSKMAGVLDHGLFLDLATDVLVGTADGRVEHVVSERVTSIDA